jgi:ubiquinone/menaquinone biosynthesis C-methylase UbiE
VISTQWANEYDHTLGKVKRHHKVLDFVVNLSGIKRNDQILDIGCGTGLLSLKFLNNTDCTITALTAHLRCLRYSKKRLKSAI